LSDKDWEGLSIDVNNVAPFLVQTTLQASYAGQSYSVGESMYVNANVLNYSYSRNAAVMSFAGAQADYDIGRFGNTLEVVLKSNRNVVQRVSMAEVDHLRFLDPVSYVSSSDFSQQVDISSVDLSDSSNNKILYIAGLAEGVVVNNAVPIGNGQYLIPVADIIDGKIEFDSIHRGTDYTSSVSINYYKANEAEYEYVSGAARIAGYANMVRMAKAGANFSARMDGSGLSMEMGAYTKAMLIATAGGSIEFSEYARLSAEAGYMNTQEVAVGLAVTATDEAVASKIQAHASSEANVSITLGVQSELLHAGYTQKQSAGAKLYAKVDGNNGLYYGDGKYGSDGDASIGAGAEVNVTGVATVKLAGVNTTGGMTVAAGLTVGAGGSYSGVYEDGTVDVGLSGSGKALLGAEVQLNVSIDTNETADTAVLLANNTVKIGYAVQKGLITLTGAIDSGLVTGTDAVEQGLISAADAQAQGIISTAQAAELGVESAISTLEDLFDSFW